MKSYFAKLADRATVANVPAPSAVYAPRVSDPFEDSSPQQTQLPPLEKRKRIHSALEPGGLVLSPPADDSRIERTRPIVETHKRAPSEPATEVPTLPAQQLRENRVSERTVRAVSPLESPSTISTARETVAETDASRVAELTPNEAPELSPFRSKEQTSKESDDDNTSSDERISELEREQALLLRKADAFMSSVLDAQRPAEKNQSKVTSETLPRAITRDEAEPISRLEPVQRLPPTPAQVSDGPSLVIGKLTVEVISPTPSPAPPQPQRIIVRGSRSRGGSVISARRFGLGQF